MAVRRRELCAAGLLVVASFPVLAMPAGAEPGSKRSHAGRDIVPGPAAVADVAAAGKDNAGTDVPKIDLTKGPFILQLEAGHLPKRAFAPAADAIKPYASASFGPTVAYTLVNDSEPLVVAPKIQAECQKIVDTMLAHWKGLAPATVPVRISARSAYGAHANEAGVIVVYLGTFVSPEGQLKVANRDELAFLLGHELSHILLLHPRETGVMGLLTQIMHQGSGLYSNYALFKDASYSNNQLTMKPDADMLLRSVGTDAASSSLMLDFLMPGRDRHREIEADMLGLDLAWRSGYNVSAGDVEHFALRNAEDDHQVSERMQTMRGVMITIISRALVKHAQTMTSGLGPLSVLVGMVSANGANMAAAKLFDTISNARKTHLAPEVRAELLGQYYAANVKGQTDFDARTEPRPPRLPKSISWHGTIDPAANAEARALHGAMAWTERYETLSIEAMGTALEDDEERMKAEEKHSGILGKLRQAMVKTAEDNPGTDTATLGADGKPNLTEAEAKKQNVLQDATQLAAGISRPGTIDPMVASSSHGAGKLSTLVLHQEPRGQLYWSAGAQHGFPMAKLYRAYGASLSHSNAANRLPALVEEYRAQIGTEEPILDVAVGAEVAKGDTVAAEKLAAHCLEISPNGLYPSCAAFLGYNPAGPGGKAKTKEGQSAFTSAKVSSGLRSLLDFGHGGQ